MNNVKGIYLIADGLGDRPIAELNGLTPLEYAKTPTMDLLCKEGSTGLVHPYRPGCRVGTDWGISAFLDITQMNIIRVVVQ